MGVRSRRKWGVRFGAQNCVFSALKPGFSNFASAPALMGRERVEILAIAKTLLFKEPGNSPRAFPALGLQLAGSKEHSFAG